MLPALEAERALLMATAAAVGSGGLSRSSSTRILDEWRAAARGGASRERPQRLGPDALAMLGIRVVTEPPPTSDGQHDQEVHGEAR